jgi:hypothetical protein
MPTVLPESSEAAEWGDLWARLLEQEPYPYTTPLPPPVKSDIDGIYSKFDPRVETRPMCARCMPYPAEGGTWVLQLDRGEYRIFSARSKNGWRSLGSFSVTGDRLALYNDPHCMQEVGVYIWSLDDSRQLVLEQVEDACAEGWRGVTFTNYPWSPH